MYEYFKHLLGLACTLFIVFLVAASVTITPASAQASHPPENPTQSPASVNASTGTNVQSLQSTKPARSEEEFEEAPHVYDMQSIREFDLDLYRTRDSQPQQPSDQTKP